MRYAVKVMSDYKQRIGVDPAICHGQPCIRGTRIMVWLVLQYLANGDTIDDVLTAYPALKHDDVLACLAYASEVTRERIVTIDTAA